MCEVNPDYKTDVKYENGKKVLYVKVLRALYICIEPALLYYNLYVKTLKYLGLIINKYDICVSNKMIDGKQCTIVWYVDDNKLLHVDPNVVTYILEEIKDNFGDMIIRRGDTHNFLGVPITIRNENKVDLMM